MTLGWRWQLIPAYMLLLGLLFGFFLLKRSLATWMKLFTFIGALILLGSSALLAYIFPEIRFPKPTGSFAVGTVVYEGWDSQIRLFYPAERQDDLPKYRYLEGVNQPMMAMPSFIYSHLKGKETEVLVNAKRASQQPQYPLILYSYGAGSLAEDNTLRLIDLASHGMMVATIKHYKKLSEYELNPQQPQKPEILNRKLASKVVPDRVEEIRKAVEILKQPEYAQRIDFNKIGMLGFSLGGSVVSEYCLEQPQCKAVVNLDGSALAKARQGLEVPYLQLSQSVAVPTQKRANPQNMMEQFGNYYFSEVSDLLANTKEKGALAYWYQIKDTGHATFTDLLHWTPVRFGPLQQLLGKGEAQQTYQTINQLTFAFFKEYLQDKQGFEQVVQEVETEIMGIEF